MTQESLQGHILTARELGILYDKQPTSLTMIAIGYLQYLSALLASGEEKERLEKEVKRRITKAQIKKIEKKSGIALREAAMDKYVPSAISILDLEQ